MTSPACEPAEPEQSPDRHTGPPRPAGLRERKKLSTRQALAAAAMRLAIERGLDDVLVEDIAAAANVSTRTFNNYFASKHEAICALMLDRSYRIGEELRARPDGESLWEAITAAVLVVYEVASTSPDPQVIAGIRLVTSSPVLRGEYLKSLAISQYELAEAIAGRFGEASVGPFFTRGLAGAVVSAVQAATERWLYAEPAVPIAPLVQEALRELAVGMAAVLPRPARVPCSPAENGAPSAPASG
ncbi:MAG TPA: TetR/AcrR family transcriptional regulator [Streptosporangiaceae bacterium]|jgi:AcrR family transcriptional regulator|nr:TetR/AcrR family transcriptional regulator [Streptosporangiaceae bacterium]